MADFPLSPLFQCTEHQKSASSASFATNVATLIIVTIFDMIFGAALVFNSIGIHFSQSQNIWLLILSL